jgi:hypothetical protein
MVQGGGFEPPKLSRQIYSLIHLATLEPLRKAEYSPLIATHCQFFAFSDNALDSLTNQLNSKEYQWKMELAIGVEPTTC